MNKIGQVTYCGQNYGSVLQCYATQHVLKKYNIECVLIKRKEKGIGCLLHSAEFRWDRIYKYIRYPKYKKQFDHMLRSTSEKYTSGMNPASSKRINEFINKHINSVEISYFEMKKISRKEDYIAFFSGSDQIWSGTWFIKNKMWFLRFAPKNKRVAWMPSFGSEMVEEYNIPTYKKYISEYEYLSSREQSGAEIITQLTGREAIALADPVILLTTDEWKNFAYEYTRDEKYILLFFLDTPSETALEMIKKMREETGYKTVVYSYEHECLKGTETRNGDPRDFVSVINNAEFVMTDSFHACMFSIMLNVPYYVFYRNTNYISTQSARIENLLETYNMKERLIKEPRIVEKKDFQIEQKYCEEITYKKRKEVLKYLDGIIKNYNKE